MQKNSYIEGETIANKIIFDKFTIKEAAMFFDLKIRNVRRKLRYVKEYILTVINKTPQQLMIDDKIKECELFELDKMIEEIKRKQYKMVLYEERIANKEYNLLVKKADALVYKLNN